MKKTIQLLFLGLTFATTTSAFADFCPQQVFAQFGNFTAPANWHTSRSEINTNDPTVARNPNLPFTFYNASYNDQNDGRISCIYFTDDSNNLVEITTDQTGFPTPSKTNTKWTLVPGTANNLVCGFPLGDAVATDCPW